MDKLIKYMVNKLEIVFEKRKRKKNQSQNV